MLSASTVGTYYFKKHTIHNDTAYSLFPVSKIQSFTYRYIDGVKYVTRHQNIRMIDQFTEGLKIMC